MRSSCYIRRSVTGVALMLAVAAPLGAQATRDLPGLRGNTLQANDDGSSQQVNLSSALNFYGNSFSSLWVNNNGNVTFAGPMATYTPFALSTAIGNPTIAPLFIDVDTRGPSFRGGSNGGGNTQGAQPFDGTGLVTYGTDMLNGHSVFGVNWFSDCADWTGALPGPACAGTVGVGYYAGRTDLLNVFQLLLIDRSDRRPGDFDIEFDYDQVQWNTGMASGGVNGRGGVPARIGFSNGSGLPGSYFELAGSGVDGAFLDGGPSATSLVENSIGSSIDGRYIFEVENGQPVTTPEPAAMTLLATGMLGIGAIRRRRGGAPRSCSVQGRFWARFPAVPSPFGPSSSDASSSISL